MARLHPAVLDGLIEHQWNRGGRGVAVEGQVAQHLAVASVECSPATVMAEMVLDSAADVAHLAAIHAATVQVWVMVLAAILVWVMAMVQDTLVWAPNWLAFSTGDLRSSGSPGLVDLFP